MTSSTLSSLSSAGAWVLPESTGLSDRWELTFFYGSFYLAVTCLVLSCQRSTTRGIFRESTSGFISVFSSWFDSGYIYLPVFGGLGSDPAIDSRPALFVPSALLGSTVDTCFSSFYGEFLICLRELVDYGS